MEFLNHLTPHRRAQAPATSRHLAEADLAAARVAQDTARGRLKDPRRATDVAEAVAALAVGRGRIADAEARLEGRLPAQEHRPCLFDPGHGPATAEVQWTSGRDGTHQVPVCAREASRMAAKHRARGGTIAPKPFSNGTDRHDRGHRDDPVPHVDF